MNGRAIGAIARKDLKVVAQSRNMLLTLILVPLLIAVVLPVIAILLPGIASILSGPLAVVDMLLSHMSPSLQAELVGYNAAQRRVVLILVYFLAPFFLIIPLMAASIIAADSIAGEKERKTLEGLLYTPTTDLEVFTAKVLSAWVLGMVAALGGFVIYGIVTNLVAWPVMGRIFFPNATWVVLILWVVPAMSALGVSVMVLASVRAKGVQEANQVGGVVVLPIMLLVIGQATGLVLFNIWLVVLLGLLTWGVDVLLHWIGGRVFQRGEIITRL